MLGVASRRSHMLRLTTLDQWHKEGRNGLRLSHDVNGLMHRERDPRSAPCVQSGGLATEMACRSSGGVDMRLSMMPAGYADLLLA